MKDRILFHVFEIVGYWACEAAFRYWNLAGDHYAPLNFIFEPLYRLGCRAYTVSLDAGRRSGELMRNPKWVDREDCDEPMYVSRKDAAA
jgi:hypothetical protein